MSAHMVESHAWYHWRVVEHKKPQSEEKDRSRRGGMVFKDGRYSFGVIILSFFVFYSFLTVLVVTF